MAQKARLQEERRSSRRAIADVLEVVHQVFGLTGRLVQPAQIRQSVPSAYARMPAMRGTGVELVGSWLAVPVTAGFQGFLGHNEEARCV